MLVCWTPRFRLSAGATCERADRFEMVEPWRGVSTLLLALFLAGAVVFVVGGRIRFGVLLGGLVVFDGRRRGRSGDGVAGDGGG